MDASASVSVLETTLTGLSAGVMYLGRLQAWTEAVDPSTCSAGEVFKCSEWSELLNLTTANATVSWHVSPSGSYLYADGSTDAVDARDLCKTNYKT